MIDIQDTVNFAREIVHDVGLRLLKHQTHVSIVAYKDRQDIVTTADLDAEQYIITAIKKLYPSHAIFSEEQGSDQKHSNYQWVIDPLDGTKMYQRGLDQFNSSITLFYQRRPIISAIYRPTSKELYSSADNYGSFLNNRSISPNKTSNLLDSFIFTYLPTNKLSLDKSVGQWSKLQNLSMKSYRVRNSAEESVAMCWVASGKIEASLNLGAENNLHDIAPGYLIARESGAKITNLKGETLNLKNINDGFIVSNGLIHNQIIEILKL